MKTQIRFFLLGFLVALVVSYIYMTSVLKAQNERLMSDFKNRYKLHQYAYTNQSLPIIENNSKVIETIMEGNPTDADTEIARALLTSSILISSLNRHNYAVKKEVFLNTLYFYGKSNMARTPQLTDLLIESCMENDILVYCTEEKINEMLAIYGK